MKTDLTGHVYTVAFVRWSDDELERDPDDVNLVKQLTRELQEAFDCGHLAGRFQIVNMERVDAAEAEDSLVPPLWLQEGGA